MKVSIFTHNEAYEHITEILKILSKSQFGNIEHSFYNNYDDFITGIPRDGCDTVIIARSGAEGMESARASKTLMPKIPLVWFSDDKCFGPESFRVGCAYFSVMPITEDSMKNAIHRCMTSNSIKFN